MTFIVLLGSLAAVAAWELLQPGRRCEFPTLRRRIGNVVIWLANLVIAALLFLPPDQLRDPWPLSVPTFVGGFLLLDAVAYWTHRAQHAVPPLWKLHALHHSDPDVDWSTSVRHHPFEYIIAAAIYWTAVVLFGLPAIVVAAHATATFVLAVVTHANARLPAWMERLLQPIIITPDLHLVHHNTAPADLNMNFGAVFSFWDRWFGTLHTANVDQLHFGVDDLPAEYSLGLVDQLATPWRLSRASPAWQSAADQAWREIEEHRLRAWSMTRSI
jgi:sterol desaturase/sphingolipid hydroxylase (fatty acid hydroxylase superfamily)